MSAGNIKTFKSNYTKLAVTHLINQFDNNNEIKFINIKKATYLIMRERFADVGVTQVFYLINFYTI